MDGWIYLLHSQDNRRPNQVQNEENDGNLSTENMILDKTALLYFAYMPYYILSIHYDWFLQTRKKKPENGDNTQFSLYNLRLIYDTEQQHLT